MLIKDKEIISGGRKIASALTELIQNSAEFHGVLQDLAENGFEDILINAEICREAKELSNAIVQLNTKTNGIMKIIYDYIEDIEKQSEHITITE